MHYRIPIGTVMLAVVLGVTMGNARAFDETKYPNRKGQWLLVIPKTPFVVPYRVRDDVLEILRVYHHARRWPERM
jgi:hypothetical protein